MKAVSLSHIAQSIGKVTKRSADLWAVTNRAAVILENTCSPAGIFAGRGELEEDEGLALKMELNPVEVLVGETDAHEICGSDDEMEILRDRSKKKLQTASEASEECLSKVYGKNQFMFKRRSRMHVISGVVKVGSMTLKMGTSPTSTCNSINGIHFDQAKGKKRNSVIALNAFSKEQGGPREKKKKENEEEVKSDASGSQIEELVLPEGDTFEENKKSDAASLDQECEETLRQVDFAADAKDSDSDNEEEPDWQEGLNKDGTYEVEEIIAKDVRSKRRTFYYLKWKGWPHRYNTWQDAKTFKHMKELTKEFERKESELQCIVKNPERRVLPERLLQLHSLTRWEAEMNKVLREAGIKPLYIYNDIDNESRRRDFTYIVRNKLPSTFESFVNDLLKEGFNACNCDTAKCGEGEDCCPAMENSRFYYTKRGGVRQQFYAQANEYREMIVECGPSCRCSAKCPTRVVQRGRQYKVAIVRTEKCGWGVFALQDIPENIFVVEYVGEVVPVKEARLRSDTTYQFELDGGNETQFVVDSKHFGNESAFINHSCDPNLQAVSVQVERIDPNVHRIALFSTRRIMAGEELTLNYFSGKKISSQNAESLGTNTNLRPCYCGSSNCIRYWPTEEDSDNEE